MGTITARAFGLTFLSSLMIQAIAVFTGIIAARLLSADGRGELAAIILWPSIFATLGLLGTPWAITREAAQEDRTAHLLVNSVILSLILSLGTVGLGYFAVPWLLPREKQHILELVRFFLLFIPPSILNYNLMALDQGWLKWERFNLLRISYFVCYLLFLIYFWLVGIRTVKWFVVAMLVSQLVPVTLRLACQRQHLKQGRPQPREMGRLVAKGLPFFWPP
jgi:O-antigen/teichoic acid export membrane protein